MLFFICEKLAVTRLQCAGDCSFGSQDAKERFIKGNNPIIGREEVEAAECIELLYTGLITMYSKFVYLRYYAIFFTAVALITLLAWAWRAINLP